MKLFARRGTLVLHHPNKHGVAPPHGVGVNVNV